MDDTNLSTRDFLYFKTIVEEHSISKAAKKLFITQPSLSQYTKHIEQKAGLPLFKRSSSGISLTEAGKSFYELSIDVLRHIDNFRFEVSDLSELRRGTISFGITRHLGTVILPMIIPKFRSQCPNIHLHLVEDTSALQETNLLENKIDFSLMHLPIKRDRNPAIHYETLDRDPFLIILPKNSPLKEHFFYTATSEYPVLDIRELKNSVFIMIKMGQRIRQITDYILEQANILQPDILIETSSISTLIQCVGVGLGVGVLPRHYLKLNSQYKNSFIVCSIPQSYNACWYACIATTQNAYLSKADLLLMKIAREAIHDSINAVI